MSHSGRRLLIALFVFAAACATPPRLPSSAPTSEPETATPRAHVRAAGGWSWLPDTDLDSDDIGALRPADASFDRGVAYTFGVGYRVADDWSLELELGYRANRIDRVLSTDQIITAGDFTSLGVFANARYHLPLASRLRPHFGLGLGLLEELEITIGTGTDVDYSDSAVAIQAIAGVDYAISPRWSVSLEGRYLQSFGQDLAAESGLRRSYEADYQPISVLLGLSWSF